MNAVSSQPRYRAYGRKQLEKIPCIDHLSEDQIIALKSVAAVMPFRVNNYVIDELIDWDNIPNDPMYQLTFPQVGMIEFGAFQYVRDLVAAGASDDEINLRARKIQRRMNPHPGGQLDLNLPTLNGEELPGMQHKYRETVLFFPAPGQTCHAYCTYCFRWPQFVGIDRQQFAHHQVERLFEYLELHQEVSDLLVTGGDPMVMSSQVLRRYLEPLLDERLAHLSTIRIGSKALAYWPYRFISDRDTDDLLRFFEQVVESGRQLAFMAHFSHPRELQTPAVEKAIRHIRSTGATIRCQAPLIRHVNDQADSWAEMWRRQVQLGMVPYYMFVERDTGPRHYFEVPLARAVRIFDEAFNQVTGLARTVRGPSMSATPGKVLVDGITEPNGERAFALRFLQGRDPEWVNRIFYAKFDSQAVWLDDLEPAFGEKEFFFEPFVRAMEQHGHQPRWRHDYDRATERFLEGA